MSSYVNVDMDSDAYIEVLTSEFGHDVNVEAALLTCETTDKIHINRSESNVSLRIKYRGVTVGWVERINTQKHDDFAAVSPPIYLETQENE